MKPRSFGRLLRSRRGRLPRHKAAKLLGISARALENYERGFRVPPVEVVTLQMLLERLPLLDAAQPAPRN